MARRAKNVKSIVIAAFFCFAVLLCSAPARGQKRNKRCYTVEETLYKIHDLKLTPKIKPIEHCYSDNDHPYRYSVADIPMSLAVGTVRTSDFSPPSSWYWILLEVEKPLPTKQMTCMMAVADDSPQSWKECPIGNRLLQADWTIWEDGKVASSGSSTTHADGKWTRDNIFKFRSWQLPDLLCDTKSFCAGLSGHFLGEAPAGAQALVDCMGFAAPFGFAQGRL
jgi:hypothetical protein